MIRTLAALLLCAGFALGLACAPTAFAPTAFAATAGAETLSGVPLGKGGVVEVSGLVPPLGFTMTEAETGKTVTAQDFRGKTVLLYFGYTNCPDVCPDTLYKLHMLFRALGPAAKNVVFLFVTIDPKRDTDAVLANYVALFDTQFRGLRGTPDQIYRLARRYRVVASVHPSPDPLKYQVVHSALVYVFDAKGRARFIIPDLGLTRHPDYKALAADIEAANRSKAGGVLGWLARFE